MPHTDLVGSVAALGNPENMYYETAGTYSEAIEYLLYDDFGFQLITNKVLSVDDHGEARKLSTFQKEDVVIGLEYEIHPEYGITKVDKPYFMKPKVVTTYVFDKPVF